MSETRAPPFFIGDDLALDFLNSLAAPWGAEIEWIGTGGDFVAWLEQAHAVPAKLLPIFAHTRERERSMPLRPRRGSCVNGSARSFVVTPANHLGRRPFATWRRLTSCLRETTPIGRSPLRHPVRVDRARTLNIEHYAGTRGAGGEVPKHCYCLSQMRLATSSAKRISPWSASARGRAAPCGSWM